MNPVLKRVLYIMLGIFLLGVIIYPKLDVFGEGGDAKGASFQQGPSTITVQGRLLQYRPINYSVKVTGTILADESVELKSEVNGKVDQILFKEGQSVRKGELLITLNDDELAAELEKLRFTKKLNEDNEFRQRKLLETEAISREEYEVAQTTLNTSMAEIKLIEARQAKHNIKAPFDGKIGLREVSVGSYISIGTIITRIYSINPVKVDFSIPGRYLKDINIGDKLTFVVDAYPDPFSGEIYAMEPRIDPQSRSIQLRALSPNPDGKLVPGQFAKINLVLDEIEQAIMVPSVAVIPELNASKVFILKDGKALANTVETGIRTENEVQVVSGLSPGDTLITSGLLQIRSGMKVNVAL